MTETIRPDICVIGAGSGGLSVAAAAAAFGVSVALVERGRMGGDCLNYGCVPSKALIAAAHHAHIVRSSSPFGIAGSEPRIDFAGVNSHVRSVIDAIAPNDSVERFTALGVRVIQAEGRFADPDTLVAGDMRIRARRFVIATGSSPVLPAIEGIDTVDVLTNETIFDLTARPDHLMIIGAGPVGLELAQAHRRLGARVTVVEAGKALAREDPELAKIALARLIAEGVDVLESCRIDRVDRAADGAILVHVTHEGTGAREIRGSHLMVAAGRRANLDALCLEAAGIARDGHGLTLGRDLRTSNRRVYAIGDAAGRGQFTHLANHHAGIVIRAIVFRLPIDADAAAVPRATFTDPQIAQVGMTEDEARKGNPDIRVLRWPYAENDRAQAERSTDGLIKIVADRRGRLLGVSICGAGAAEMANLWSLAISKRLKLRDVAGFMSPYPTFTEIGKRAAVSYFSPMTRKPLVRQLVRFLQRFG